MISRTRMPAAEPKPDPVRAAGATVDVAITAYRRATYIAEAVESVIGQTYDRWQLTICDNGRGGGAIEDAVRPYLSDRRVAYAPTGRDLTLAENWTKAIQRGAAEYVAILNDDDRWHPDFLRARVEALEAHPECGFAFGAWVQTDDAGVEVGHGPSFFPDGTVPRELLAGWLTRRNIVGPPTILVRRSAYEAVGAAFDGNWHYCDWEMWARLAARFQCYYVARADSEFRRHSAANTFAKREDPRQLVAMVDHVERLFGAELADFRVSRLQRARNRSYVLLNAAGDVYTQGGWRASGALYRRALLEYPAAVLEPRSVQMLARTILGKRLAHALAGRVRSIGRPGGRGIQRQRAR